MAACPPGVAPAPRHDETRRALLAKAGLLGTGIGLAALARGDVALAAHNLPVPLPQPDSGSLTVSDVRDWGALGDGAHNDGPNIQQCIDDSAGEAAVYIPPGTYRIDHASGNWLKLPSETVLIGHGPLSVLKSGSGSKGPIIGNLDTVNGNSDIEIENLTLDANGGESIDAGTQAIRMGASGSTSYCERVFIRRVEAKNVGGPGAGGDGGNFALALGDIKVGSVQDCHIHHCEQDGITLVGKCEDVVIQGNVIHDCADDHIAVYAKRVLIAGNICNANFITGGAAIAARGGEQIKIVGNMCRAGAQAAIAAISSIGAIKDVEIAANTVLEGGATGDPGAPGFGANGKSGILVQAAGAGTLEHANVVGNMIVSPRNHGIALGASSTHAMRDVSVTGNLISMDNGATLAGSGIASTLVVSKVSDVRLSDNEIVRARGAGIHVAGANNERFDIHDNQVFDSGTSTAKPGILVTSANGVAIIGNRAQDTRSSGSKTQDYGLTITNPTGDVVIVGNTFTGNSGSVNGGTVNFTGSAGTTRLRIRDNPGFNPWSGQVAVSGPWTPFYPAGLLNPPFYSKHAAVTFSIPFPSGSMPRVVLTTQNQGFAASAFPNIPGYGGFTCSVWYPANVDPGSNTVNVNWLAEPGD